MTDQNSGGEEKKHGDVVEKLENIDKWLNEIVHVQDSSASSVKPSAPQKLTHTKPSSQQRGPFKKTNKSSMQNTNQPKKTFKQRVQNNFKPKQNPSNGHKPHGPTSSRKSPAKPVSASHDAKTPRRPKVEKGQLLIIPLGGLEEVGKNMMMFEYENDIIIVDMGFQFPTEDMLGVDYVLPDITYLIERKHKIRGIYLTHGHLDHIGAIPYLLPKLGFPPVYGAPLTIGFVEKQIKEFELTKQTKLIKFDPKETLRAGAFVISFFRVNHSIPDAVGIVIDTPCGRVVHTGDFKFDFTPADQRPADFQEIAKVGSKGVTLLISDSTNAVEPGHTVTEKVIQGNLDKVVREAKGRLIITSFASLIGRLQQIMDSAIKEKRKIFLTGRSMKTNIQIAQNLGYINIPKGMFGDIGKLNSFRDEQIIIITTGSQGEDLAGLARMAMDTHPQVKLHKNDTVVLSSNPIIGNGPAVVKVLNGLVRRGAKVITNKTISIHTSGHAKQEDLKLMMKLIKPKYMIPAHGDYFMRLAHQELAVEVGIPEKNVFLCDNGEVVMGDRRGVFTKTQEAVPAGYIMVEGPERSEVANHILMDRQLMSENGAITLVFHTDKASYKLKGTPSVESRGFVYMDMSKKVIDEIINGGEKAFRHFVDTHQNHVAKNDLIDYVQHQVDRLLVRMLDKRPLIIPVIVFN